MKVRAEIKSIRMRCDALSGRSMNEFFSVVDSLNVLKGYAEHAGGEFKIAAGKAQAVAERVATIQAEINSVQYLLERRIGNTYDACRAAADRALSDPELRRTVFERDGRKCVLCPSVEFLTVDHIKPVALGGGNELSNLQTLCLRCNSSKGAKYQEAA